MDMHFSPTRAHRHTCTCACPFGQRAAVCLPPPISPSLSPSSCLSLPTPFHAADLHGSPLAPSSQSNTRKNAVCSHLPSLCLVSSFRPSSSLSPTPLSLPTLVLARARVCGFHTPAPTAALPPHAVCLPRLRSRTLSVSLFACAVFLLIRSTLFRVRLCVSAVTPCTVPRSHIFLYTRRRTRALARTRCGRGSPSYSGSRAHTASRHATRPY